MFTNRNYCPCLQNISILYLSQFKNRQGTEKCSYLYSLAIYFRIQKEKDRKREKKKNISTYKSNAFWHEPK